MIERGAIVLVSFPFVEEPEIKARPALVISDGPIVNGRLLWVAMITGSTKHAWPLDISTGRDYAEFGLKRVSTIRLGKVSTVETTAARVLGRISDRLMAQVDLTLRSILRL